VRWDETKALYTNHRFPPDLIEAARSLQPIIRTQAYIERRTRNARIPTTSNGITISTSADAPKSSSPGRNFGFISRVHHEDASSAARLLTKVTSTPSSATPTMHIQRAGGNASATAPATQPRRARVRHDLDITLVPIMRYRADPSNV
jgi:hypothetical protein